MRRLGVFVALVALLAPTIAAVSDVAAPAPAAAAPADVVDCSPDSPYIYNLNSENGSPSGTDDPTGRTNAIERVDVRTGATTTVVDLSTGANRLTQQLNGLGISANGQQFYFVSHNIDRRAGETIDSATSLRQIYVYDIPSDTLTSVRIPWNVWDPGADHIARHGAVDPATGIYYFATAVQDADASTETFDLVAYDPNAPAGSPTLANGSPNPDYPENVWLAGTITTPGVRGNSGDMAFDAYGNLVFLISRTDSVGSIYTVPRGELPSTPGETADITAKSVASLEPAQAGGNAVGLAFGQYGYLFTSYTDGTLNRIDPSTGETITSIGTTPLGSGGQTTDLASCATPSSLTVVKDVVHRHESNDQFTLQAVRDSSDTGPEIGEPATTTGSATGVQDATVGPVPILLRTVNGSTVTNSRTYYVSETGSGADLADYSTTLQCVDQLDPSYQPTVTPVSTASGTREWQVVLTPHTDSASDVSTARAIRCTFTNADIASPQLTLAKKVTDPHGVAGDTPLEPASAWTLTASGADTLSGPSGVAGAVTAGTYTLSESGPDGYSPTAAGWTCATDAGTPVTVTNGQVALADGQRVTCTIENQPTPGTVTWTKVDESGAALAGSTWRLTGPAGYDQTVTDDGDGGFSVSGLPWGDYTLTETAAPPGYAISSDSTRTFTVGPGETTVALGDISDVPAGALAITKAWSGTAPDWVAGITFTGTYRCELDDEVVAQGTWSSEGTGPATLTSTGGAAPTAIPAGADCEIEEDAPSSDDLPAGSWAWEAPTYTVGTTRSGTVAITAGQTSAMTVTNAATQSTQALSVVKQFSGGVPDFVANSTFTGTYSCTVPGGETSSGTWTITGLGEATLSPVPSLDASAACTGTETTPISTATLPDSSWHWGTPTVAFDDSDPAAKVLRVTNSVSQSLTTMSIHKAFDGTVPDEANGKVYAGRWTCTLPGSDAPTYSGTWSATAGGTAGPFTVPQGASCTITETAPSGDLPAGWAWNAPAYSPAQTVTLPDSTASTDVTVTNSVTHLTGTLAVTKAWSGTPPAWASGVTFHGSYTCTYDGATSASGTWTVTGTGAATLTAAAGSPAPDAIPAASDCTVSEAQLSDGDLPDGSWSWNAPSYSPAGGTTTIAASDTTTVAVTNSATQSFGSLSIEKALGPGAPDDVTYSGSYQCLLGTGPTLVASGTWTITGGGAATLTQATGDVDQIPVTSDCRVSENALQQGDLPESWSWEPPEYSSGGIDVGTGGAEVAGATTVTVTNAATQSFGALAITKAYDASVPAGSSTTFTGDYTCLLNEGVTASGTWSVTGTGTATLTPAAGSAAADRIPAGSLCSVAEAVPSGGLPNSSWSWGQADYSPGGGQVTVANDATATVTVTNSATQSTGGLVIEEEFEGGDPPPWAEDLELRGSYECTLDGQVVASGDWTAKFGESAGPFDVAAGASCTVTQDELPAVPDESWHWGDPSFDPSDTITVPDGGTGTVTVTDRLTRVYGAFSVDKAITGEGTPPAGAQFSGSWQCTYLGPDKTAGTADDEVVTGTWGPITAGTPWVSPADAQIPRGSSCVVTSENTPAAPGAGLEWFGEPELGGTVNAAADASDASIRVVNVLAVVPGLFSVTKRVDGTADAGLEYSGHWQCTFEGQSVSGTWGPIAAGETWTAPASAGIPVDADCAVTDESGRPDAPVAGGSASWATPQLGSHVDAVGSAPESDAVITVVNRVIPAAPTPGGGGNGGNGGNGGGIFPLTGTDVLPGILIAAGLIAAGLLAVWLRRRRRGA